MNIRYRYFENHNCESQAREIITGFQWLLPPWLHELNVDSMPQADDETMAYTAVKPEYGLATIDIYPLFWDTALDKQRLILLHEVIHVVYGRVHSLIQHRLLPRLKETNPDLHLFCEDEFRERTEEFVECLARALSENSS